MQETIPYLTASTAAIDHEEEESVREESETSHHGSLCQQLHVLGKREEFKECGKGRYEFEEYANFSIYFVAQMRTSHTSNLLSRNVKPKKSVRARKYPKGSELLIVTNVHVKRFCEMLTGLTTFSKISRKRSS
jgi:hypothetical protein